MILIEHDLQRCGDLWIAHRSGLPFDDWELRCALAASYGIKPAFLIDEATESVLPCGKARDALCFFGGEKYSELNHALGPPGSVAALLEAAISGEDVVRLLAWDQDPLEGVGTGLQRFDVPYNQYWVIRPTPDLAVYAEALPRKAGKELLYLNRKFVFDETELSQWQALERHIMQLVEATSSAFAKRNRPFALDDERHRAAALSICETAFRRNALHVINVVYQESAVGACVIVDDPQAREAVYLLNLYHPKPSDVSNGVTLAAINYAIASQRRVNGLRGAFTLKRKYGFIPEPSYALVKDPRWQVSQQTDLNEEERRALYGRDFGAAGDQFS